MKRQALILLVSILCWTSIQALNPAALEVGRSRNATVDEDRSSRFLSLFSIVRFANSLCFGTNGFNGTCLTSAECASLNGGTASGSCASGFGVRCTVLVSTCGSTITRNNTYWRNPGFSNAYSTAGQCSVTVQKCTSNICQLRLDFVNFVIADPDGNANTATQCLTDLFTVTGNTNNVPAICGTNTNQHMYLHMTPGNNQFTLNMLLTGTTTARTWDIRISQIPCGANYEAPQDCLQYFTEATGTFSSFNYQFSNAPAVQHLANQDYTVCIRMAQGFCGICYAVCDVPAALGDLMKFLISDEADTTIVDAACLTDFVQIPCAVATQTSAGGACTNNLCGAAFSAVTGATVPVPVYSYRKPFQVRFYTDGSDAMTTEGIGFCLQYQQLPCVTG